MLSLVRLAKIFAGVLIGKTISLLLKLFGKRGTALPGLIVEKIIPDFLAISRPYLGKLVVITGTNGKTTTQTILAKVLAEVSGQKVIVNSRGANLSRGLVSELIKSFKVFALLKGRPQAAFTIFEIEEATFPRIASILNADLVIVTNFFRDQLDAYGEIERTKMHVMNGLKLSSIAGLIINADDPQCIAMVSELKMAASGVSIGEKSKLINYETSSVAGSALSATLKAENIVVQEDFSTSFELRGFGLETGKLELKLPGIHSIYALLFSIQAAKQLVDNGFTATSGNEFSANLGEIIKKIAAEIKPPFGRGEIINYEKIKIQLFLIKNPAGFDATLDMLTTSRKALSLAILINDKIADGKDVSWLWDSSLEKLNTASLGSLIVTGGTRAIDMQLRLKYALRDSNLEVKPVINFADLLDQLKLEAQANNTDKITVLATYTAMNQLRDLLISD